jgi:hypothetical protein
MELLARELIQSGDANGVEQLFRAHPELLTSLVSSGKTWLHYAAWKGTPEVVRRLFDLGIPLNTTNESGECPLSAIARHGDADTARWMVEHRADPGVSQWPMIDAVSTGSLEIVRLFVEHGAASDFTFGDPPRTLLSQALDYGHQDVADYLRSVQSTLPPLPEGDRGECSEPAIEEESFDQVAEIQEYFEYHTDIAPQPLGLQELIPGQVNVSVWTIDPGNRKDPKIIFTTGMSEKPLPVPEGFEERQHVELMMYLPPDWPCPPSLADTAQSWPWIWLRAIAHNSHEHGVWLGEWTSTFANGDPPQPLDASTPFCAFVLATNFGGYEGFPSDDGRFVNIVTAVPIYPEELALAKRPDGIVELLQRFEQRGIKASLRPGRPNAALEPEPKPGFGQRLGSLFKRGKGA